MNCALGARLLKAVLSAASLRTFRKSDFAGAKVIRTGVVPDGLRFTSRMMNPRTLESDQVSWTQPSVESNNDEVLEPLRTCLQQ